ncbi:MAG: DEAD/DEAH box helicase [Candidatus Bathyarchaeota archaeon]|jgi:SNF2 family DNA or RNA helicase
MAKERLSDTFLKAGLPNDIYWADDVIVTLPDDYLPFKHQYEGLNLISYYDRAGLFDEAGTGKTLPVQANLLFRVGQGNKCVVLTNPTLIHQFYRDMHETFQGFENYVSMDILSGTSGQRKKKISLYDNSGWPDILMMSYDLFRGTRPPRKPGETKKEYLLRFNINEIGYHKLLKENDYSVMVCDEAHALRNPDSTIHKRVHKFIGGDNPRPGDETALVLLTATPAHTHVEQCYGLIRLKSPECYGGHSSFERLHIEYDSDDSGFSKISGYKNLDMLALHLYKQARRVEKRDVAPDMPDKINTIVPVELDKAHYALYKKLINERMLELEDRFIDAIQEQSLRQIALQLVTNPNEYSDKKIKDAVFETLMELLTEIDLSLTKVLIFCHYNKTAESLKNRLAEYGTEILNGTVRNKQTPVDKFLHDDKCRLLVAHPKSAGAGLNFQSVCHNVVFYECPDSPGDLTQASERVHRIVGTDETVNNYLLSPMKTWAAKKIRQVAGKEKYINDVVGDTKKLLIDLFDGE